jgi:hypothetical protein
VALRFQKEKDDEIDRAAKEDRLAAFAAIALVISSILVFGIWGYVWSFETEWIWARVGVLAGIALAIFVPLGIHAWRGDVVWERMHRLRDASATAWNWIIFLAIVGGAIYGGHEWLDSIGWISHRQETVISARSDWLVGESKECWSASLNSDGGAALFLSRWGIVRRWSFPGAGPALISALGKEVSSAMSAVSCDDGPEHKMKVTFYGRRVQPEYKVVDWRCTRNEVSFLNDNSFTCYQTGGQR